MYNSRQFKGFNYFAVLITFFISIFQIDIVFATTLIVTNTNNTGVGSLRNQVNAATAGDSIRFDNSTNGVPIVLSSEIFIDKKLYILGNGRERTILSGNSVTRIIHLDAFADVYMEQLSFADGNSIGDNGGAILNSGIMTLSICNFYNNSAGAFGGAITNTNNLVIENCNLWDNNAVGNSGGAILSYGAFLQIRNSSVYANHANGFGGGLELSGTATLTNCTVSGNGAGAGGGGIFNDGDLTINNCTITKNSDGLVNDAGTLLLMNSILAGNTLGDGSNAAMLDPTCRNNVIGDNSLLGIPIGNGNYFGIVPELGSLGDYGGYTLTHSLHCDNWECIGHADPLLAPLLDQRGFARQYGADIGSFENHFQNYYQVTNINDSGPGSLREAVANPCDTAFVEFHPSLDGYIIFLLSPIDVKVHAYIYGRGTQNTIISGNSITRIFNVWSSDTLDLSNLTLTNGNSGIYNGGCVNNDGCLQAQNVKFLNNQSNGNGGTVFNSFVVQINHSTFESNRAYGSSGGAIFQTSNSETTLGQCILDSNYATGAGGAVYGNDNTVIENCTFSSNHSDADGGAVHMTGFSDLVSCTLTLNSANGNGGALSIASSATVYLKNTIIAGNSATLNGPDGNNSGVISSISLNNLIGDNSGFNMPAGQGNILDQNAMLDVLADNGGVTMTHALLCGSPAINEASTQFVLPTDQRDSMRVGLPDIGAYEFTDINTALNISGNGETITAVQFGAQYQWFNCNTNLIIAGQTNSSYTATVNGSFAMIITNNGCTDTSDCINITTVGIDKNNDFAGIEIYPNPVHSKLTISSDFAIDIKSVTIFNTAWQTINIEMHVDSHGWNFDTSVLPAGMYIAEIRKEDQVLRMKFVKE